MTLKEDLEFLKEHKRKRAEEWRRRLALPEEVSVEVDGPYVYVAFARRTPRDKFEAVIRRLKNAGFRYDPQTKTWYYREPVDADI